MSDFLSFRLKCNLEDRLKDFEEIIIAIKKVLELLDCKDRGRYRIIKRNKYHSTWHSVTDNVFKTKQAAEWEVDRRRSLEPSCEFLIKDIVAD